MPKCFAHGVVQVARVNRPTVSTNARPRVESLETEWLCFSSVNDLPNIDAQFVARFSHFIDEADVSVTVTAFKQLGSFRFLSPFHFDDLLNKCSVEFHCAVSRESCNATNNFRGVLETVDRVPWINPLW